MSRPKGEGEARGRGERLVVKVGTNTLCGKMGRPDPAFADALAGELTELMAAGHDVILVSSGAIGSGMRILGFHERPQDVRLRQACAAVGQGELMRTWREAFEKHGRHVAQVLLTYHTFANRRSYLNLKNALETILELGVVPVVNENDTVSIEEIDASFGDNDRLSALVASKMQADRLVLMSDVAGLFTKPPGVKGAELVPEVREITDEVRAMAGVKPGSGVGRGGMRAKLAAVEVATDAGVEVSIVGGRTPRVVSSVLAGEKAGTRFLARGGSAGMKAWLRQTRARGRIEVDAGAARALKAGKHLLPAGVVNVQGTFDVESLVEITHDGEPIAKALAGYSSDELARVKGLKSEAVHQVLGTSGPSNVTRKGALVLLGA